MGFVRKMMLIVLNSIISEHTFIIDRVKAAKKVKVDESMTSSMCTALLAWQNNASTLLYEVESGDCEF